MYKSKNPIFHLSEELAEQIAQVTEYQIDELLHLVESRYNQLLPERDGVFCHCPGIPPNGKQNLLSL